MKPTLHSRIFRRFSVCSSAELAVPIETKERGELLEEICAHGAIGVIAGNGPFPLRFTREAKRSGCKVVAVCHTDETDPDIEDIVDSATWIRVGQLGKMISAFQDAGIRYVAMAGGISRINHFSDVRLDSKGAKMLLKLRSTKDDIIMRGIATELQQKGIEVVDCTIFMSDCLAREGVLTQTTPDKDQWRDIEVGTEAIRAISSQDIGQLVVVRDGVVVAVEAVEGTNAAILRGGSLGGKGAVVVKFAKVTQDMRFDVPTVGVTTIETMIEAGAKVLALEAGRSLIIDEKEVCELADRNGIAIVGCEPLVEHND